MRKRNFGYVLVILALAVGLPAARPARAAFWQELADTAWRPELVCKDGIYFGLADFGPYSYRVRATLDDESVVIDNQRVTIGPGPVDDSRQRSHSGFFRLPWSKPLATGTVVKLDFVPEEPILGSSDPTPEVEDCFVFPQPEAYIPLMTKP